MGQQENHHLHGLAAYLCKCERLRHANSVNAVGAEDSRLTTPSRIVARLGQCYVLKLRRGKWYVGYTEKGVQRILDHMDEKGAKWTKKYSPVDPVPWERTSPGKTKAWAKNKPNSDEDKLTLKLMKKHGIQNVRGGSWCMVKMRKKTVRELEDLIGK